MKVLLYGSGAREHALAWKISQSDLLEKLYLCKANDGFASLGENFDADNFVQLAAKAKAEGIGLLIVGPEAPLAEGIADEFKQVGIPCIGADKKWARLESSKSFAKEFMVKNAIPTAKYCIVESEDAISQALDKFSFPVVLKADGLAAGKGVSIVNDRNEAQNVLKEFLGGKYGSSSKKIVVEEFLDGEEVSLIALWDGKTLLPLIPARDYKRLCNDNEGPNTGGMGSYCPVDLSDDEQSQIDNYVKLLQNALRDEQADFTGIIYSGLMLTDSGIKVLEYNMRFGDPETQPLMMHLDSDLLEVFDLAAKKQLDNAKLKWKQHLSLCVVAAAQGYPENPKKDCVIGNSKEIAEKFDVNIFYAGVKHSDGQLLSNGGRVLSVCKTSDNPFDAIYNALVALDFQDKFYRTDIGRQTCRK